MSDEEYDGVAEWLDALAAKAVNRDSVDVEKLVPEIEKLRAVAIRYANAVTEDSDKASDAGLDLETAAIQYVRKLDKETCKAKRVDYLAIVEQAERDRERSGN
jgi:hypothetical protein